jgi:hypothetical protein
MGRDRHQWRRRGAVTLLAIVALSIGVVAGTLASRESGMVVVPFEAARFAPLDPSRPDAAALAVLWGDPRSGPSDVLLKMKKTDGALHFHTSDYHLALLQGQMKHWAEGTLPRDAAPMGPGSYWFQPGRQVHGDACLTDECVMFIHWAGPRDGFAADTPAQ